MRVSLKRLGLAMGVTMAAAVWAETDLERTAGPASRPWRRLFFQVEQVIESQDSVQRVFHPLTKHPGNPIIKADRPWEGKGPMLYGSVFRENGVWRMWYMHKSPDMKGYWHSYAESKDGLTWDKPSLGNVEFNGSRDNNLVFTVKDEGSNEKEWTKGETHNMSVMVNPLADAPEKKYICFTFSYFYGRARWAYSADGRQFTLDPKSTELKIFPTSDVVNVTWDPYRKRFVATRKMSNYKGRAAGIAWSSDGLTWEIPKFMETVKDSQKGKDEDVFVPQTFKNQAGKDVVRDFVMGADDQDPSAMQVYAMPVFAYQGLYLGLVWMYPAGWPKTGSDLTLRQAEEGTPCRIHTQLAWSTDLINWHRTPNREPLLAPGPAGAFDSHMIFGTQNAPPLVVGDELWLYFSGCNKPHNQYGAADSAIGLAKIRLDGFVSMHAGEAEGSLVTNPEPLPRPAVRINASVNPSGYLVAELLDEKSNPLPGFGRAECVEFKGDAVSHLLTWKTGTFDEAQGKKPRKIRFILKNADLYSYLPEPE